MENWQKRLLTIAICEIWGLITFALVVGGSFWLKTDETLNILGMVCFISCGVTGFINYELSSIAPYLSTFPVLLFLHVSIYAVIGLIISIFVCRKTKHTAAGS